MFNVEPLLHEVARATHRQNPRVAARFHPFGLETEREPVPLELPKPGRDHTFGITSPVLDIASILTSIRETGAAPRGRFSPDRVKPACYEWRLLLARRAIERTRRPARRVDSAYRFAHMRRPIRCGTHTFPSR